MPTLREIPLSLYVHMPWCIRKCPYCDFNSHALQGGIPEQQYIDCLLRDLEHDLPWVQQRSLHSIFIGGGTPSLFSGCSIETLLKGVRSQIHCQDAMEITLEANPGSSEQQRFRDYRAAGVNRLSLGIQSFSDQQLKKLGRVHDRDQAKRAVFAAQDAGFTNINIDIMYGLPQQSVSEAMTDLEAAIALQPQHISWYQLTVEPNTPFYKTPPPLPQHDQIWEMEQLGRTLLNDHSFQQYEISAYSQADFACQHNLNYWQFGDYLGIGAGAHAKLTDFKRHEVHRLWKLRQPNSYLQAKHHYLAGEKILNSQQLPSEFMLNALRLMQAIPRRLFEQRTGLAVNRIEKLLQHAAEKNFLIWKNNTITLTDFGRRFLNDLLEIFI